MKYFVIVFSLFLSSFAVSKNIDNVASVTAIKFSSPEESIRYFVEAVRRNDLADSVKAFASNEMAEDIDYAFYCKRLGVLYTPTGYLPDSYRELNREKNISDAARCFKDLIFAALGVNPYLTLPNPADSQEALSQFAVQTDPVRLKQIKIISIKNIEDSFSEVQKQRYAKVRAGRAKVYNAQDAAVFSVHLSLNEREVYCDDVYMIKIRNSWKIEYILKWEVVQ